MVTYNECFKCEEKFEDKFDKVMTCYICRKSFCINCYKSHNHNNVEANYETLFNIVKEKSETLHKPILIDWATCDLIDIYENSIIEKMTIRLTCRVRCDFKTFHRQLINIKERFNYLSIEMILRKKFCFDIYELILSFI